jgi:circadian clock protein KaiC
MTLAPSIPVPVPAPVPSVNCPTGIAGLDLVLGGGLPYGRTTIVAGGPGSGKTVLGMHFLMNGAQQCNEPGIMVSFEESAESLISNVVSFGPLFERIVESGVFFLDGRPPENVVAGGDFDLQGLIAIVGEHVRQNGAKRIVFDGLDAILLSLSDEARIRELLRLFRWLEAQELTGIVSVKAVFDGDRYPESFGAAEYAASAVIKLGSRVMSGLVHRFLRVVKVRGASFSAAENSYSISARGLDVAYTSMQKPKVPSMGIRLSTGIEPLDRMLKGGYLKGTLTLISGLPGTAKTTLASSLLAAALKRGERCLYVAFDEPADQVLSDVASVGIQLGAFHAAGILRTASFNAGSAIADDHALAIERLIEEHRPAIVVIDPVSALEKAGGSDRANIVCERLANRIKVQGITGFFTAVTNSEADQFENSCTRISTIADTWLHLNYAVQRGERNRTLTIVKSRGTGHSNQVRELLLTDDGVTLRDAYFVKGDVLLGTARLEREQQDKSDRRARDLRLESRLNELEGLKASASARIREAEREVAQLSAQAARFSAETAAGEGSLLTELAAILGSRQSDD